MKLTYFCYNFWIQWTEVFKYFQQSINLRGSYLQVNSHNFSAKLT